MPAIFWDHPSARSENRLLRDTCGAVWLFEDHESFEMVDRDDDPRRVDVYGNLERPDSLRRREPS